MERLSCWFRALNAAAILFLLQRSDALDMFDTERDLVTVEHAPVVDEVGGHEESAGDVMFEAAKGEQA